MPFSDWWVATFLSTMGWPREEGLLRKRNVVDSMVADQALTLLGELGVVVGADASDVGLRLLTASFNREWDEQSVAELTKEYLDKEVERRSWDWAKDYQRLGAKIPWEFLGEQATMVDMQVTFIGGLWFGLTHAKEAREVIDVRLKRLSELVPEMKAAGVHLAEESVTRETQLKSGLETISLYEETRLLLPEAPTALVRFVDETRAGE